MEEKMLRPRLTTLKRVLSAAGWLPAFAVFVACSFGTGPNVSNTSDPPGPATTPTPTRTAATGQTSKTLVSKDPRGQYFVIKRTLEGLVPEPDSPLDDQYEINSCYSASEQLGVPDTDPIVPLVDLAYEVIHIGKVMRKARYPESVWRAPLAEFENRQLTRRLEKAGYAYDPEEEGYVAARREFVRLANEYREEAGGDNPEIIDEGGCGAGEVGIIIATRPEGGRVHLMPVFFYNLCKAQNVNPDDPAQCEHWLETVRGALTNVAGDYVYRAVWPDGAQRSGRVSFTNLEEGQTVSFDKP
jgi:hypothetical protein